MCGLYNYKLVNTIMTWDEARSHCKSKYTDLATLPFQFKLPKSSSTGNSLWIGLHRYPNENRTWRWSRPDLDYVESEAKWGAAEPNDTPPPENCVHVDNRKWIDRDCSNEFPFFCYDGKNKHVTMLSCVFSTSS